MEQLKEILEELLDMPVAYHHFNQTTQLSLPFFVYYLTTPMVFYADNIHYNQKARYIFELYTEQINLELIEEVEAIFESLDISFTSFSTAWIDTQMMYQTSWEGTYNG